VTLIKDLTAFDPSTVLQVLLVQPINSTLIYNTQPTKRTVFLIRLNLHIKKSKGTVHARTGHERTDGGVDELLYSFFNLDARWDGWSTPGPGRFTPREKNPVLILQEAGRSPGTVLTGAENLAPTGIRSPDLPVGNESLYRLSYTGPRIIFKK
jgi:hypothetical protein